MEVFIVLVQNVTLLIAIVSIYSLIAKRWNKNETAYIVSAGILFGSTAVIGMTMPYTLIPGVIFDGRTVIHNVAGLFGGPYVAAIAAVISSAYRYSLGGAGAFVGVSTIIQSSLFGILFHYLHKNKNLAINPKTIVSLSILTNIVMLAMSTTVTGVSLEIVITKFTIPIMLLYPPATFIIASIIIKKETEYSAQEALKKSEALKGSIIDAIPDLLIRFDRHGTYLDILTDDENSLIKPRNELIGKNIAEVLPKDLANKTFDCIQTSLNDGGVQTIEYSLVTLTGFNDFEARITANGEDEAIAFIRDISDRKIYESKLEYYSKHDHLTGLYNRAFFEDTLKRLHEERNYPISVITADIDGLKLVNDTLGHEKGNEMLLVLREIIKDTLRQKDVIARIDGDEYAAILPAADFETAQIYCDRILEAISRNNDNPANPPLSLSLGFASALSSDKEAVLGLLSKAEESMYHNKIPRQSSRSNRVLQGLIAALEERDHITNGHADRVQKLCINLGEKIGLSTHQLSNITLLSRVHDLGKVGIPDKILFKPTKLEVEEWEVMKQHPEKGYRIAIASIELAGIAPLILKHHEHWNGNGYPLKLKGEEIPIECRILSIVDAYDAMTNDRPYSKARTKSEALAEIRRCAGTQFDPALVDIFESVVQENLLTA